ncbi:E3 ubiquitin-protein ligase rpm-1 [Diplonema papillatum]|nr:E3 ubiquitin-protein ligase rpm-1 [Diplonema papillatum]
MAEIVKKANRSPPPLDDISQRSDVSSIEARTPRCRDGPLYQIAKGAPLLSPVSPAHRLHSGDPTVSLQPTPGRPEGDSTAHDVKCSNCGQLFSVLAMKLHLQLCAPFAPLIPGLPTCDQCGESLALEEGHPQLQLAYFLNDCAHVFSRPCLGRHIRIMARKASATRRSIRCPSSSCSAPVAACDLLNFLSAAEHDRLLANEMNDFMEAREGSYVSCPQCTTLFERVGQGGGRGTDACSSVSDSTEGGGSVEIDGKMLNRKHYEHYQRNRHRCPVCTVEFCGDCATSPYHIGNTCAEYGKLATSKLCRFCDSPMADTTGAGAALLSPRKKRSQTCGSEECELLALEACTRILPCTHACPGIANELICPPCLYPNCGRPPSATPIHSSDTRWCSICYTEELRAAPSVVLACGHFFHHKCVNKQLLQKWPGARISFGFMNCPECSAEIAHAAFRDLLKELSSFRNEVRNIALLRLRHEGLDKDPAVSSPDGAYFSNPVGYAEAILSYYQCYVCERPYFGGVKRCDAIQDEPGKFNPSELVCASCVPFRELKSCRVHGSEFIEYKCKFCCSVAQWLCWGTTHFCSSCHRMQERGDFVTKKKFSDLPACSGKRTCPLRVDHPTNGYEEFALGCAVCRLTEGT